jgi:hypothetical protein
MRPILLVTLVGALLATPALAQTVVSSFPAGTSFPGGAEFDCLSNIVWLVDSNADLITAYDPSGVVLRQYPAPAPPGTSLTPTPIGVGYDVLSGMVWVGDEGEYVYQFDPVAGVATGVSWPTTPAITDVSGVAMDPQTGNIFVVQDSGTRVIVEFDQAGTVIQTIPLAASGSGDPDGLGFNVNTTTWYLGDDTADTIYEVDNTGTALNSWSLGSLGISPEGLGVDPVSGFLYVADGFGGTVWVLSGIVPSGGLCVPGIPLLNIAVTTSGAGDMVLTVNGIPPSTIEGWTFFTLDTSTAVGAGPIFGITPDLNTIAILSLAPIASPGNPLHWTWPAAGVFPQTPFGAPPGSLSAFSGTSWDFLAATLDAAFNLTASFNVMRVTW